MGVWHISGLGLSPGAVTVPLTYIYLCLKQASQGNSDAQTFSSINSALLLSAGFTSTAGLYYYLFQPNTKLLHLEMDKPDFKKPNSFKQIKNWHELPIFSLGMSELYEKIKDLFQNREKVNVSEIKNILKNLGFPEQFFAKLRGSLINVKGDIATRGYMLGGWLKLWEKLDSKVTDFSKWKEWAKERQILLDIGAI